MRCLPLVLILAACGSQPTKPVLVEVPGPTLYVDIPESMTAHPPLPPLVSASPLQCPAIAKERRDLLEDAYLQLDAIKALEGTPKKDPP